MGLYDGIKDVAKIVQQADNIELYGRLLDLSAQALDMQEEIAKLRVENTELKQKRSVEDRIIRHKMTYITLKNDELNLKYCAGCWDSDRKLIQMKEFFDYGKTILRCTKCRLSSTVDQ